MFLTPQMAGHTISSGYFYTTAYCWYKFFFPWLLPWLSVCVIFTLRLGLIETSFLEVEATDWSFIEVEATDWLKKEECGQLLRWLPNCWLMSNCWPHSHVRPRDLGTLRDGCQPFYTHPPPQARQARPRSAHRHLPHQGTYAPYESGCLKPIRSAYV